MSLTGASWVVIVCALVMANLPFICNRPLAPWPWRASARNVRVNSGLAWLLCLAFLLLLALWVWATLWLVGGAFAGGGGLAVLFLIKLLVSVAAAGVLLWLPGLPLGRRSRADEERPAEPVASRIARRPDPAAGKPFVDRFLEVLVGYILVGTLGFSFELNLGNAFPQGWEFYAVTLALFLVLGYPGFVWRYMLKRRHHPGRGA